MTNQSSVRGLFAALAALFLSVLPAFARAGDRPPADEIVAAMDRTISGYADQIFINTMTITDVDGSSKSYEFTAQQKGDSKRLVRFTSGEVKGMSILIMARNQVYIYLPGYKKVRRVAASNMKQTFAGSDLSNDDMAVVSWSRTWQCAHKDESETAWRLDCTPRPGEQLEYAGAVLTVEKGSYLQLMMEYRDAAGTLVKRWTNSDLKEFPGGLKRHSRNLVEDPRTGHKTLITVRDFKANLGYTDDLFTPRQLEWGR